MRCEMITRAERDVARVDALGEADEVGDDVPAGRRRTTRRTAEAGHDLVADHDDAVPVAELAHPGEVAVGRDEDAVGAHHRLEDDRRRRCAAPSYHERVVAGAASARSHSSASGGAWNDER